MQVKDVRLVVVRTKTDVGRIQIQRRNKFWGTARGPKPITVIRIQPQFLLAQDEIQLWLLTQAKPSM